MWITTEKHHLAEPTKVRTKCRQCGTQLVRRGADLVVASKDLTESCKAIVMRQALK